MRKHLSTYGLIILIWAFIMGAMYVGCFVIGSNPEYVKKAHFKAGEILPPSYACTDTLIVVNVEGLNNGINLVREGIIDPTDYKIDSILHENCIIK